MKIQKRSILIVIVVVLVAGLFGWMFSWQSWKSVPPVNQTRMSMSDDQTTGSIPTDWKLYSSDTMGFSMYYDPSLTLQEDTKTDVRFYKQGPSQRGQTEMYDGVIVTVRKVSVPNGGQVYIDDQIEQYKNVGNIIVPLHDSKLNGISTKEYGASGFGDAKMIFVPINNQTLLEVSYMVPDPTNAGFQKTVDLMLSTFKLK